MRASSNYLILGVIVAFLQAVPAFADEARIVDLGGGSDVLVKREGKDIRLKKEDVLKVGDELVTDKKGSVDIRLSDKTLIRVGANSSYKLEEDSTVKKFLHKLLNGIVRVVVPKGGNGEIKFRMDTPDGTIGVRGTEFVVDRRGKETLLQGLEGSVLFGAQNSNFSDASQYVLVSEGMQSIVKAGDKRPSEPQAFDRRKQLQVFDSKEGVFGELAARKHGAKHMRVAALGGASQAVTADSGNKSEKTVKAGSVYAGKGRILRQRRAVGGKTTLDIGPVAERPAGSPAEIAYNAISIGDLAKFKQNLADGKFALDTKVNDYGDSLLHAAAELNRPAIAKFLVEEMKMDINILNNIGQTPLIVASYEKGGFEVAQYLVEKGAALGAKDKANSTALDYALDNFQKYDQLAPRSSGDQGRQVREDLERWKDMVNYLEEAFKKAGAPIPEELKSN